MPNTTSIRNFQHVRTAVWFIGAVAVACFMGFLYGTTPINIWPEYYVYPWLITHGILPYRDFFINHGALMYYAFGFVAHDTSLIGETMFFYAAQGISLLLMIAIMRRTKTIGMSLMYCMFWVMFHYLVVQNHVWDEVFITTLLLGSYYMLEHSNARGHGVVSSLLIGLASMIKPVVGIAIIAVVIKYKSVRPLITVVVMWVSVGVYHLMVGGLQELVNNVFVYNGYYHQYFLLHGFAQIEDVILYLPFVIFIAMVCINILNRTWEASMPLLMYTIASMSVLWPRFITIHFPPFVAFLTVYAAWTMYRVDKRIGAVWICVVILLMVPLSRKVKHAYMYFASDAPFQEGYDLPALVADARAVMPRDASFFLMGNEAGLYFYLGRPYPTRFPLLYDQVSSYYDVESVYIDEILTYRPEFVLMPTVETNGSSKYPRLQHLIEEQYTLTDQTEHMRYLRRAGAGVTDVLK